MLILGPMLKLSSPMTMSSIWDNNLLMGCELYHLYNCTWTSPIKRTGERSLLSIYWKRRYCIQKKADLLELGIKPAERVLMNFQSWKMLL